MNVNVKIQHRLLRPCEMTAPTSSLAEEGKIQPRLLRPWKIAPPASALHDKAGKEEQQVRRNSPHHHHLHYFLQLLCQASRTADLSSRSHHAVRACSGADFSADGRARAAERRAPRIAVRGQVAAEVVEEEVVVVVVVVATEPAQYGSPTFWGPKLSDGLRPSVEINCWEGMMTSCRMMMMI
jgi:hypothetical protein